MSDMPAHYAAWTWQGSAEVRDLALREIPARPLAPGEVWVKNAAIGLNPVDWKVLVPPFGPVPDWLPGHVPGVDGAGTVVATGPGVDPALNGVRVAYHQNLSLHGSFSTYTPLLARALMRLPEELDFATAAGFPCPGLTAWLAIGKIPPRRDADLLISGAGGAVGNYLVQFAVRSGYRVTVLCNPRHWDRLRMFGASNFIEGPLPAESKPVSDTRYYAIVDCVDENHARRLVPALSANGHIVCIQGRLTEWPNPPFGSAISMHEVALGALHKFGTDEDWARLTAEGEAHFRAMVHKTLIPEPLVQAPFEQLAPMLEKLHHRDFSGKPVIIV